jgi:hypothetical protein
MELPTILTTPFAQLLAPVLNMEVCPTSNAKIVLMNVQHALEVLIRSARPARIIIQPIITYNLEQIIVVQPVLLDTTRMLQI